jgi:CO/xanthine dehydrogenase FAD-binding subunit
MRLTPRRASPIIRIRTISGGLMGAYLRPATLEAALSALAARRWTVLAGGTDHYPARGDSPPDEDIIDIASLPGQRAIVVADDHVLIPCGVTWSDVIAAPLPAQFHALKQAAAQLGGRQVQNAATVIGNLCNASPAADGIPCLLALDAKVELASASGTRLLPVAEFLLGPRATARRPDELATALRIPRRDSRSAFLKLGARRYLVISIAMVAAVAEVEAGRLVRPRIALGACGPVAARLPAVEAVLDGHPPDPARITADMLAPIAPIDDVRATAAYRRAAALELVRRAVAALA